MAPQVLPHPTLCKSSSLQENPQFFLPAPPRREFDMLGMKPSEPITPNDFQARWWPGDDISESR